MSTLTALARAQAVVEGRAQPIATVRHLHVHDRPLVLIPLAMAGEANAPLAAMAGTDRSAPRLPYRAILRRLLKRRSGRLVEGAGSSAGRYRARAALCDLALDKDRITGEEPRRYLGRGTECQFARCSRA